MINELVDRAIREEKWIYSPVIDQWYSPFEFREKLMDGEFQASRFEWQLKPFDLYWMTLREKRIAADLEMERANERMRNYRLQRREECLGV